MFLSLLLTADPADPSAHFQPFLMHKCLRLDEFKKPAEALRTWQVLRDGFDVCDVCHLRCVQCVDTEVRAIIWQTPATLPQMVLRADLRWLPPTTETALFDDCSLRHAASTRFFPRALEYIFLRRCQGVTGPLTVRTLQDLPPRVEEFHIVQSCTVGQVSLENLPHAIRIVTLSSVNIDALEGTSAKLPRSFEGMYIESRHAKFKVRNLKKLDRRIHIGPQNVEAWGTARYAECDAYLDRIAADIDYDA